MKILNRLPPCAFAAGLLAAVVSSGAAQTRLMVFGGWDRVPAYGSDADYNPGINDFPVTPAHSTFAFGFAVGRITASGFGLEISAAYIPSVSMTLTDPSDGDTVAVSSAAHADAALNLLWEFGRGLVRPYVIVGGGVSALIGAKSQTGTSALGFEVLFDPPGHTVSALIKAGGGLLFQLSSGFGLRIEGNYFRTLAAESTPAVSWMGVQMGAFIALAP